MTKTEQEIVDRLESIQRYTDPRNPEGLGKRTDLLFNKLLKQNKDE